MKKVIALMLAICGLTCTCSAGYIITSCGIAVATVMGEEEDQEDPYMTPEEWQQYLQEINDFYCGAGHGKAIYKP